MTGPTMRPIWFEYLRTGYFAMDDQCSWARISCETRHGSRGLKPKCTFPVRPLNNTIGENALLILNACNKPFSFIPHQAPSHGTTSIRTKRLLVQDCTR